MWALVQYIAYTCGGYATAKAPPWLDYIPAFITGNRPKKHITYFTMGQILAFILLVLRLVN
jgi:hypothetical protein